MRRIRRAATVVIAGVMLQTCGDNRGPTAPTTSSPVVRGTVLDFQTQTPIAGAAVRVGADPFAGGAETVADVNGRDSLPQPPHTGMFYYFAINNSPAGRGYPAGANYRGDLLVDTGTCVSRYGVVIDGRTLRPIAGASVGFSANTLATTSRDGWYRIDWGCPSSGTIGFNTTFLSASHSSYTSQQQIYWPRHSACSATRFPSRVEIAGCARQKNRGLAPYRRWQPAALGAMMKRHG
jgi:hypothetical protein